MHHELEIQLEALIDIKSAYSWYEEQKIGLGDEFIVEIEECYVSISEYPERYGHVNSSTNFRRIRIHRFPYIIVFEYLDDIVIITRVAHIKQDRSYI